jgi:hypothetical protein
MNGAQSRRLLTPRERKLLAIYLVSVSALVLVAVIAALVSNVPTWLTDWQAAHGRYPTGHLTYTVPTQWTATTLTGLQYPPPHVGLSAFEDQVALESPTYSLCFTDAQCATQPPTGAGVTLESAPGGGRSTIEAWYQNWATATNAYLGPTTALPLSDYTAVSLGGQHTICATSQEGSQLLPPYVPPSPHFDATFAGYVGSPYVGQAVVMCFALWHGRVYYVEATVQLHHTATKDRDLRAAAQLIESVHFT